MIKVGKNAYHLTKHSQKLLNNTRKKFTPEKFLRMGPSVIQNRTLSGASDESIKEVIKTQIPVGLNLKCSCGCNVCFNQPKGDKKIAEFLNEEIKEQFKRKDITSQTIPNFEGFEIENRKAEVILRKKFHNESLTVKINVNHSDNEDDSEDDEFDFAMFEKKKSSMQKLSRSYFCIEIQKDLKTLIFYCSVIPKFLSGDVEYQGSYNINYCAIYEEKCTNSTYFMAKETGLDGYLQELLLYMLHERGITYQFIEQLQDYCAVYEHVLYIEFLEKLKNFVTEPYT